uniref:Uncharacterized protein n=1 Tax=Oryzias latipes TaxID=8090 RepID=A0A3P9K8J6_ORYLA
MYTGADESKRTDDTGIKPPIALNKTNKTVVEVSSVPTSQSVIEITNGTKNEATTAGPEQKKNDKDKNKDQVTKKIEGTTPNEEEKNDGVAGNKGETKKTPIESIKESGFEEPESSHFFAYLVSAGVLVAVLYVTHHNKRKIIAFFLEGKRSRSTQINQTLYFVFFAVIIYFLPALISSCGGKRENWFQALGCTGHLVHFGFYGLFFLPVEICCMTMQITTFALLKER